MCVCVYVRTRVCAYISGGEFPPEILSAASLSPLSFLFTSSPALSSSFSSLSFSLFFFARRRRGAPHLCGYTSREYTECVVVRMVMRVCCLSRIHCYRWAFKIYLRSRIYSFLYFLCEVWGFIIGRFSISMVAQ